jgi:hypothetical protein
MLGVDEVIERHPGKSEMGQSRHFERGVAFTASPQRTDMPRRDRLV